MQDIFETIIAQNRLLLLWPVSAIAAGIFLYLGLRSHYRGLHDKSTLGARWYRRLMPLAAPVAAILLLVMGMAILTKKHVAIDADYAHILRVLILSWLGIAAIYVMTHSRIKTALAGLVVAALAFIALANLTEDIVRFLSDISFSIGNFEISLLRLCKFVICLVLLSWLSTALLRGLDISLQKTHLRPSTRQLFRSVTRVLLYTVVALSAVAMLGIDLRAFAVFGGALGVGLGFGLQKTASNFISGLILLFERSIEVNDMIEMHNGDTFGIVRQTGARYTLVETFDNREVMVPNEDFITQRVTNWTLSNARGLIKVPVSVSYEADLEEARRLLLEVAHEHPRTLQEPAPNCQLISFTDLGVNMQLNVWVGDIREKRITTQSELLMAIWKKFTAHKIGLPYQVRESHYRGLEKRRKEEA